MGNFTGVVFSRGAAFEGSPAFQGRERINIIPIASLRDAENQVPSHPGRTRPGYRQPSLRDEKGSSVTSKRFAILQSLSFRAQSREQRL